MTDPEPTPFDQFQTIGAARGEGERKTPLRAWLALVAMLGFAGVLAGGGVYVGYEFWLNGHASTAHERRERRTASRILPTAADKEQLHQRLGYSAAAGGVAGVILGIGMSVRGLAAEARRKTAKAQRAQSL